MMLQPLLVALGSPWRHCWELRVNQAPREANLHLTCARVCVFIFFIILPESAYF